MIANEIKQKDSKSNKIEPRRIKTFGFRSASANSLAEILFRSVFYYRSQCVRLKCSPLVRRPSFCYRQSIWSHRAIANGNFAFQFSSVQFSSVQSGSPCEFTTTVQLGSVRLIHPKFKKLRQDRRAALKNQRERAKISISLIQQVN